MSIEINITQNGILSGTTYNYVRGNGTPAENGIELQAKYEEAKEHPTLSATERFTVIIGPGEYLFPVGGFIIDTDFIDVVSLTGERDVIIDVDVEGDPFIYNADEDLITGITECLNVTASDCYVRGIKGKLRDSPECFQYFGVNQAYILPIQVGDDKGSVVMENCEGGPLSFGSSIPYGVGAKDLNGKFINCKGAVASFAPLGTCSGIFIDCEAEDQGFAFDGVCSGTFTRCKSLSASFGYSGECSGTFTDCKGGIGSFAQAGICSGTFISCTSEDSSFASNGLASGIFTDCEGGHIVFGAGGTASGTFTRCKGGSLAFGGGSTGVSSGTFVECIGETYSFGGAGLNTTGGLASGTYTNCIGGDQSFGGGGSTNTGIFSGIANSCIGGTKSFGSAVAGQLTGKLYYCRLTSGTFRTVSGGGRTVYCIDGSNNTNNQ